MRITSTLVQLIWTVALIASATTICAYAESPFQIRGVKGLWWQGIENYKRMVRWLPAHHFNFLMFCYTSFPGSASKWRMPYSEAELRGIMEVAAYGEANGIIICLAVNPAISSHPPLQYGSEEEIRILLEKFLSVYQQGVSWFALCLDDISTTLHPQDEERFKTLGAAHSYFVNEVFTRLRQVDSKIELVFCPSAYTTGAMKAAMNYIIYVGEHIDPAVKFFWTGPQCCSVSINEEDAKYVTTLIKRKPIVWDNYPVNDYASWRLILGPIKNRAPRLGDYVLGLMSNPMKQAEASKLPLATIGDYLWNPSGYDPEASIAAAIQEMGRGVINEPLRELVRIYGSKFLGDPGFAKPPQAHSIEEAKAWITKLENILSAIGKHEEFEALFEDLKQGIEKDIVLLKSRIRSLEAPHSPPLTGLDFFGGGAERFGYTYFGRDHVNYVYAQATPCASMTARFTPGEMQEHKSYELILEGCDDDSPSKCAIEIVLNGRVIFSGKNDYPDAKWAKKSFHIPAGLLKKGENTLEIRCLEPKGSLGMPPWFMVSEVEVR